MRLKKLEINGFKSFAKRTELEFGSGVTAIVGPNGCGKSNISDAVRWVLGEQSARVLRGNKMEDVIFNGTEQRKPLSFCEVALTFDNTDGELPVEYTEVSVTRRVYRSGESEYLLNGAGCRLRDIHELFRDTGIGREGYSTIGQGRVEEILSNKSGDRRAAFEEAAGVMKYRVRKEEAERKLENTKKNLVRLQDILEELDARLGPLGEQNEAALAFLRLRDELREIEVNLFLHQYDKLTERIAGLNETMAQLDAETEEQAQKEVSLSGACEAAEEKERAVNAAMNELQNKLLTLSSTVESSAGEAKVMQERMTNLQKERERLREQIDAGEAARAEALREIEESEAACEAIGCKREAAAAELAKAEAAYGAMQQEVSEAETQLEAQKNSLIEAMNRISDARSRASRLEVIRTTLQDRLLGIAEEEKSAGQQRDKLHAEYQEAAGHLGTLQADCAAREAKRNAAIQALNEVNQRAKDVQQEAAELARAAEAARSRLRVLDEMKKSHEGYYASVRNLLTDAAQTPELKNRIEGVVAELMTVPGEYEVAIEMSLGSALQNIVTPTEQDAKWVIEHLRKRQFGRATLLPVSAMRGRSLSAQERGFCNVKGFLGVASELVRYDARYKAVFENLLGRTVLVEDLDVGIAINRKAHGAFRIATLKGDIINPGGSMTGGSSQKREFSLIGRGREIEELRETAKAAEAEIRRNQAARAELEALLSQAERDVAEAGEQLHGNDVEIAAQHEKVDIIQKYVTENAEKLEKLALERSRIHDDLEDIERQSREAETDTRSIEAGNTATQDDIRAAQAQLSALRAKAEACSEEVTERKVGLMGLEKELSAAGNDAQRMRREAEAMARGMENDRKAMEEAGRQLDSLREEIGGIGGKVDSGRQDVEQLTDQLHAMERERDDYIASLKDMRTRRDEFSMRLGELRERRHQAELKQSRSQMELQTMQDRIWEDYALTYENAQPLRRQIAVTASNVRLDELKRALHELGDVNVGAIEDYRNVKERFDMLTAQVEDLTRAEADLQKLIGELVATMEQEFKKRFVQIQENFAVAFSELFGGGRAELVLTDKDDILNCDIDIIAQPPGKKLQMLSLLSGGERALTAIALIFAILKLKPTAFCILDEIESALDEVNVINFANYVKQYAQDTQFILITHRKGSMEMSDAIYGVSMEERGISRVISARFSEYEKTAAR